MNPVAAVTVVPWNVPMRSPYRSAQRVTTVARNVLVQVILSDGTVGLGESAPATYVTGETQESVTETAASLANAIIGLSSVTDILSLLANRTYDVPGCRSALEMACLDAFSQSLGVPLFAYVHGLFAGEATVLDGALSAVTDVSLPILPPAEAAERASEFARQSFRSFKIKVGSQNPTEDEERVRAVAEAAPNATLRIDGNQGFTSHEAIAFVQRISDLLPRIELFEQPTKAGDDDAMQAVQDAIPLPVFADESIHHPEDARRLVGEGICQGVVLKLAKSALAETWQIAQATNRAGGECLFGCMMETRIGITAALHLTLALGQNIVPMLDLDGHLLVDDTNLVRGGFLQSHDVLTIEEKRAGLGVRLLQQPASDLPEIGDSRSS